MARQQRLKRRLRHFIKARDGATALEFAIVAIPFFMLVFATFELGLVFMVSAGVENAVDDAARKIRTGELQNGGGGASGFKSAVCAKLAWLGNGCSSNLTIDVRTYPKFADINPPDPIKNGKVDTGAMTFVPGGPEDIVLVRAFYKWKLFTPMLSTGMQNLSDGQRLISAAATFRNEPYQ